MSFSEEIKTRPQNIVSSRKQTCDRVALGRRRRAGYPRLHEEKRACLAINSLSRNNRRFRRDFKLTTSQTLAELKRITRMSSPIARILHFSFETVEDSEL